MCFESTFFSRAIFSIPISQIVLTQCWICTLRGAKCNEHLFQLFSTFSCRKNGRFVLKFSEIKKNLIDFFSKTFKDYWSDCVNLVLILSIVRRKEYWAPSLPICYLLLQEKQKIYLKIFEKWKKIKRFLRKCLRDNGLDSVYLVLILKSASCIFLITNFNLLLPFTAGRGSSYLKTFKN